MLIPPDAETAAADWVALTPERLPVDEMVDWATVARAGAVVAFVGVVRDHAEGRDGVTGLTYEAYERAAADRMREIAAAARRRWPDVCRVGIVHRLGDLGLSDASVAVVVSSPHRADAFEAARYCIDTLKETVPIWKREHWDGGSEWGVDSQPIRAVDSVGDAEGAG